MSNLSSHKIIDLRYSKHFEVKLSAFTTGLPLFTKISLDMWRWYLCMYMCLFAWIQMCICMTLWMSLNLSYLHWDKVSWYLTLCSLVLLALKIQGFSHSVSHLTIKSMELQIHVIAPDYVQVPQIWTRVLIFSQQTFYPLCEISSLTWIFLKCKIYVWIQLCAMDT